MITAHPYVDTAPPKGLAMDRFLIESLMGWRVYPVELLEMRARPLPAAALCPQLDCPEHFLVLHREEGPIVPFVPQINILDAWFVAEAAQRLSVHAEVRRCFAQAMRNGLRNPVAEEMKLKINYEMVGSERQAVYSGMAVPPVRSHRELWHLTQQDAARLICVSAWLAMHQRTE